MLKVTEDIIFLNLFFLLFAMGAIRYSCPIRLVPTYILPAKDIRLLGLWESFSPIALKLRD